MAAAQETLETYKPTDSFFGQPYLDIDERRETPVAHRYVHGGFTGTATRFSFYFPDNGGERFFQYLEGGYGGSEKTVTAARDALVGLRFSAARGAFFVESNQGHIGAEPCPKAGDDATIYAYRASAEVARFARFLAASHYGRAPAHGYVFGGSGGGFRTLCCMENTDGVWSGGVASMIGSEGVSRGYAAMNNARRLLGAKFQGVVDAIEPGGTGDPFAGLTIQQREALADLYAHGFPRGAERSVVEELNAAVHLWTWRADTMLAHQGEYFRAFWNEPGHAGADGALKDQIIDLRTTVERAVTRTEMAGAPIGAFTLALSRAPAEKRLALRIVDQPRTEVTGARITILSGAAKGRQLYCVTSGGGMIFGSGIGEAQTRLFDGVEPGDEVWIDNRDFLAYCHYYRHHLPSPVDVGRMGLDGHPIYPQHPHAPERETSPAVFGPIGYEGALRGPVFLLQHTHDTSGWPAGGAGYAAKVRSKLGAAADQRFRMWWLENAEHIPAASIPARASPQPLSRLINYGGAHEATLDAMVAWVERGQAPPDSCVYSFDDHDNALVLPGDAHDRLGLQATAIVCAEGGARAEVKMGEPVTFTLDAEVPLSAGAIVEIAWDFEGKGAWSLKRALNPAAGAIHDEQRHVFDQPGTYFPAARIVSHLSGEVEDPHGRIANIARCRVVVGMGA